MKINMASKLTQYVTNINEMRFLMRNSIKHTQQYKNEILCSSISGNNATLISIMNLPLLLCIHYGMGNPLIFILKYKLEALLYFVNTNSHVL